MNQYDPFDLAGQQAETERRELDGELKRQLAENDFKWLMGHEQGRRIVWGILDLAGVFRSSYTGDAETFFREGQRNIGLILLAQINEHCPAQYAQMVDEQSNGRRSDDTRKPGTGRDGGNASEPRA